MNARGAWLAAALLALAPAAQGAFLDLGASDLGGNTVEVTDLGPGLLGIDPDFATAAPMQLAIVLEPEDGGAIAWNALVDNLTGEAWSAFEIALTSGTLFVGSARGNGGEIASIDAGATLAVLHFDPPESAGLDLGAPFEVGTNWRFEDLDGLLRVRLTPVPVPEAGTLALVSLGFASLAARRRGRGDRA